MVITSTFLLKALDVIGFFPARFVISSTDDELDRRNSGTGIPGTPYVIVGQISLSGTREACGTSCGGICCRLTASHYPEAQSAATGLLLLDTGAASGQIEKSFEAIDSELEQTEATTESLGAAARERTHGKYRLLRRSVGSSRKVVPGRTGDFARYRPAPNSRAGPKKAGSGYSRGSGGVCARSMRSHYSGRLHEGNTLVKRISMRKEYDFSKGERGKFYHPDAELNLPVFLHPDVAAFLQELAEKKGTGVESIVNDWLRKSIDLVQSAK